MPADFCADGDRFRSRPLRPLRGRMSLILLEFVGLPILAVRFAKPL